MSWILGNLDLLGSYTLWHLLMTVPPIILAFLLALPVGQLARRVAWLRGPLLTGAGLLYAIPSLPLFIVLPAILGTSIRSPINVVVALTLYGIALMARSVADGLDAVDDDVRESSTAMGMSAPRRFFTVDLPLAGPTLLAGLRVVAVSTTSLVTVSAVLGTSSIGMAFIDGFQRSLVAEVVAGIILTVLVALALDALLVLLGRLLMPWTRQSGSGAGGPGDAGRAGGAGGAGHAEPVPAQTAGAAA